MTDTIGPLYFTGSPPDPSPDFTPRYYGAKCDGSTDDTTAVSAFLAAGGRYIYGTCETTLAQNAVPGPLWGPGQVVTSDGNKRGPIVTQIGAAPASLGNWTSVLTAFNGDLSKVHIAAEHRIGGSLTLGQPASGYMATPETAYSARYFYNSSGWNQSTSVNTGRTAAVLDYSASFQVGQADLVKDFFVMNVTGVKAGATSFLANGAISPLAGTLNAFASGTYLEVGDINFKDNGFDVSAIGLVENFYRTNNTGALGTTWMGIRLQSLGTQPIDAAYSISGPATIGVDLAAMKTGNAALAMPAGTRIYGNATNTDATHFSRYTTLGTEWIDYDATNGWQIVVGNTPIVSVSSGAFSLGAPVKLAAYTVATLPAASAALKGSVAYVTDATAPTYNGALTGGGSVVVPVFCNGSAWVAH